MIDVMLRLLYPPVPIGWNVRQVTADLQAELHRHPAQKSHPGFSYCPVGSLVTISTEMLRLIFKYRRAD